MHDPIPAGAVPRLRSELRLAASHTPTLYRLSGHCANPHRAGSREEEDSGACGSLLSQRAEILGLDLQRGNLTA